MEASTAADPLDQASELSELFLQDAMAKQKAKSATLPHKGSCYACHEPGIEGVFCDAECSQMYEELKRNGKI